MEKKEEWENKGCDETCATHGSDTPKEDVSWEERFKTLFGYAGSSGTFTGVRDQEIIKFFRQELQETKSSTRRESESESRLKELEILKRHIEEQLGWHNTINKESLMKYIETAKAFILSNNPR